MNNKPIMEISILRNIIYINTNYNQTYIMPFFQHIYYVAYYYLPYVRKDYIIRNNNNNNTQNIGILLLFFYGSYIILHKTL